MKRREPDVAHTYFDGLIGIEIGAPAHNPFGKLTPVSLAASATGFVMSLQELARHIAKGLASMFIKYVS